MESLVGSGTAARKLEKRLAVAASRLDQLPFRWGDNATINRLCQARRNLVPRRHRCGSIEVMGQRTGGSVVTSQAALLAPGARAHVSHDEVTALTLGKLICPEKRFSRLGQHLGHGVVAG